MALLSPEIVNNTKKAADTAAITTTAAKELLSVFNNQNKNLFEMVMSPQDLTSLSALGWAALDTALTTVYIQSISIPFFSVLYERANHEQFAANLEYPENITIHFYENEEAFVRAYMQKWMHDTVKLKTFSGEPGDYVFADNQYAARKQALIFTQTTLGLPSPVAIKITGMRFQSMEAWDLSQDNGEPLIISVNVCVDNISLYSPLTPLLG